MTTQQFFGGWRFGRWQNLSTNWHVCLLFFSVLILGACGSAEQPAANPDFIFPTPTAIPPQPETARIFRVVSAESEVGYEITESFLKDSETILGRKRTTGFATTRATTSDVEGALVLDFEGETVRLIGGEFSADIRTLKSNRVERDNHLRSSWLESDAFPQATFTATSVDGLPSTMNDGESVEFVLNGTLSIREIGQPAVVNATAVLEGDTIRASGQIALLITDFGFDPPSILTAVEVDNPFVVWVELTLEADG